MIVANNKWTVAFQRDGRTHKLCKVLFGQDGSYYVTVPYHPARKALILKQEVNYARAEQHLALDTALELATLEDDDARLKISHHPDGFLQFSGRGVLSGRNAITGAPLGVGTMTWPLSRPVAGPSFALTIVGVQDFETTESARDVIAFSDEDLDPGPEDNGVVIEGYYFAVPMRRFLSRDWRGRRVVRLAHPSRGVLELPVCLTDPSCDLPGFIGLEVRTVYAEFPEPSGYLLSTSTGNARRNQQGELLGDALCAVFPASFADLPGDVRRLDYRPDEPPYRV